MSTFRSPRVQIQIGTGNLTVHRSDEMLVTAPDGAIDAESQDGYFCADTRFVSRHTVRLGGKAPVKVSASVVTSRSVHHELVNDDLAPDGPALPPDPVHLRIDRVVGGGVTRISTSSATPTARSGSTSRSIWMATSPTCSTCAVTTSGAGGRETSMSTATGRK
jgi:hypothetical protein